MAHGGAKAVKSLNWAMFAGNEEADDKLKRVRKGMIAAAEAKDTKKLLRLADEMFTDDHRDEYENLKAAEEDDPGGPIRWARDLLKLPNEQDDHNKPDDARDD